METQEATACPSPSNREQELAQEVQRLRGELCALKRRMETRSTIDKAKCLLIEEGATEEEAFGRMRTASMNTRRPLAEVAQAIILTHQARL